MILALFFLVYLAGIVQAVAPNSTSPTSPLPACDGSTRSVWGILGSCALTLLICVWHAIHLDIEPSQGDWILSSVKYVLAAFFVPEYVVSCALEEWWIARKQVIAFRRRGYEWSMTHGFFAQMGGFTYRNEEGKTETIKSLPFLDLCEEDKIANPVIAVHEIMDKSKSDWLAKAILVIQLIWFGLQVVVRAARGLAVTLLELDTVVMASLSLLVLWLWWEKPYHPQYPHLFYYSPPGMELPVYPRGPSVLKNAWKPQRSSLSLLMECLPRARKQRLAQDGEEDIPLVTPDVTPIRSLTDRLVNSIDEDEVAGFSAFVVWVVLGGLHLIAWNSAFPTEVEKIMWRVASLVLAGSPLAAALLAGLPAVGLDEDIIDALGGTLVVIGTIARALLAALMLASLRSLPPSAYQTVPWTAYIPHL